MILLLVICCRHQGNFVPKPRGYFRIDFPERAYRFYTSECRYSFEYPVYAKVIDYSGPDAEPCWINLEFSCFNCKLHITYKDIEKNLATYTEDMHTLASKHIPKADDIIEHPVNYPDKDVYGIVYDIKGNTASAVNFFITDSTENFLSAALYFNSVPNKDSLAPVIAFLRDDIQHLIKTFEWN